MTVTNPAAEAVKAEFPCEWRSAGWGMIRPRGHPLWSFGCSVSRQRELFAVTNSGEAAGEEPAPLGGLLPQTGQLWWPAILLAALGLLLLLRAFRLRRRK